MSSLHGAAGSLDQAWADQDTRRESPCCRPVYEAQEHRVHRGQRDPLGPALPCANRIYFWWSGSWQSASSAPALYKSGWTWWTSGPVTTEEEGGGRMGDLFKRSLPRENGEEKGQGMFGWITDSEVTLTYIYTRTIILKWHFGNLLESMSFLANLVFHSCI